jgi:hypothetical protein
MVLHLPHPEGGFGLTFNDVTKDDMFYILHHSLWSDFVFALH